MSAEIPDRVKDGLGTISARAIPWPLQIPFRIEDALVIATFLAMVFLPLIQGGVNLLNQHVLETPVVGIVNSASIVQHGTLIIGMIGGAVAARRNRLLSLATTSVLPSGMLQRVARIFAGTTGAVVAFFLGVAAIELVSDTIEFGGELAYGVREWVPQLVMPIGFGLIALRQIWHSSDGWIGRVVALGLGGLTCFGLIALGTPPTWLVFLLLFLLLAATILGTAIFATLGGAALILFWKDVVPLASISVSHHSLVVNSAVPTIPLFTLAGYLLAESKASQRLVRVFQSLFASMRGGPAVVTVIVCAFFTSFTGASGVTILALGALLMPVLLSNGYSERSALGLVTGSGALGMLFPPCLPLILYSIIASEAVRTNLSLASGRIVSIESMFLAALVPGIILVLMTAALGIYLAPRGRQAREPFNWREALAAIRQAKWELFTPVVALAGVFGGFAVEAAALTALYALFTQSIVWRDLRVFRDVPRVILECGLVVGGVLLILGVAQGFTTYLIDAQVPDRAIEWTTASIHSPLMFLLLLNLLLLVVGCLMDVYSATIVIIPLLIPIAASYNIDPLHLGVIFLANLELGFLTPPVGMNLFLASYRFNKPVMQIARSVVPVLLIQLAGVLLITYVPALSTTLPGWFEKRQAEQTTEFRPQ